MPAVRLGLTHVGAYAHLARFFLTCTSGSERKAPAQLNRARAVALSRDAAEIRIVLRGYGRAEHYPVGSVGRRGANLQVALFANHEVLEDREIFINGPGPPQIRHLARRVAVNHVGRQNESGWVKVWNSAKRGGADIVVAPGPCRIDQRNLSRSGSRGEAAAGVAPCAEKVLVAGDPQRGARDVGVDARDFPVAENAVHYLWHMVEQRLPLADGQVLGVADMEVLGGFFVVSHRVVEPPVVLVLHRAQRVPIGILAIGGRNQYN